MAIQNFTTWTEVDPGSKLSQTSTTATATTLDAVSSNETYLYKDFGAGAYPGDYGPFRFSSVISAQSSTNGRGCLFSISPILPNIGDGAVVYERSTRVWWNNGTLYLAHWEDGNNSSTVPSSQNSTSVSAVALGTTFYCEVQRISGVVSCKIYSDSSYTTLAATVSITPTTTYSHRYIIATAKMSSGSAATLTFSVSNLIVSTLPIIDSIGSNNTIYANSSNVVIVGSDLDAGAFAKLVYDNQEILMIDYVANATQPYFTSPSLANVFASQIQFTDSANLQILNAQSGIVATKIVSFQPDANVKLVHNVTDVTQAGNTGSIYYGQSPAITVNDQIVYDKKSTLSYNVAIDSQGFITIDSLNTDANDSFTYRVYESSSHIWGSEGTITFVGEGGAIYISNKIKMYIRVV